MIVIAGTVRIPPENIARARPDLQAMARASQNEPGCLAFSFAFDVGDEGLVRVFEVFANAEAVAAHRASPHMEAFRVQRQGWGMTERNLHEYDVSNSRRI